MDPDSFGLIISHLGIVSSIALLIMALSMHAIFVAAEFLILSGRGGVLQVTEENLDVSTYKAITYLEKLKTSLPSIQFGLSFSSIIVGWLSAEFFIVISQTANINKITFFVIYLLTISLLHALFAGLISKVLAIQFPDEAINLLAYPISLILKLLSPITFLLRKLTIKILKIWKTSIPDSIPRIHSTEDLSVLLSQGTKSGLINKEKEDMFKGVVGFSDTVAREVMTARADVISIPVDSSLSEVMEIVKESSYSRYPVHGANADDIIGILLSKDLLDFLSAPGNSAANFRLNKIMREPYFVQGSTSIDSLLTEFKQRKLHIAIVLDEHGGVDGLVTLEDLLEEIVGDIYDESDSYDNEIQQLEDGSLIVDGGVLVSDLNEKYPVNIPEGDYDTIAGFIFNHMHKMPKEGEKLDLNEFEVIALKVVAHRIEAVKIIRKNNM